ncbi:MAG TPA: tetratricopeptide repeat protein [Gammaproteobacteria bacterium]
MTPRQKLLLLIPGFALLLGGCATHPAVPEPTGKPSAPVSDNYHLIMGELALARGKRSAASMEYLAALGREEPGLARRATLIALLAGETPAARMAADRWEQLAPHDLEAAQYQALLHARAGETAEALQYLLRVADGATGAAVGANLQSITTLLVNEPNPWRAATLMAEVAALRPEYPEGWYGAALLALQADRPAQAVEFATRALALDPNQLDVLFLRARATLLVRPTKGGEDVLAPLAGFRNASDPGLRYRFASLLVLAGRDAEADALLEDILVNAPDQHDARLARALLALDSGRLADAEAGFHQLLQRHGHIQDAFFYLGVLAERRGALDEAIDWYARVTPEVDRWLDAQFGIARALLRLDGAAGALDFFEKLHAEWPEQEGILLLNAAALLTASGHPQQSLELLRRMDPAKVERTEFDWQIGLAAAGAGELAQAETAFRRLLESDPENPAVQNVLGDLLLAQGRLAEAETLLEAAQASAPANADILDSLGWLRFRQGEIIEARRLLEESWQRRPMPETGLHLLAALTALDDAEALLAFRQAFEKRFPETLDALPEN